MCARFPRSCVASRDYPADLSVAQLPDSLAHGVQHCRKKCRGSHGCHRPSLPIDPQHGCTHQEDAPKEQAHQRDQHLESRRRPPLDREHVLHHHQQNNKDVEHQRSAVETPTGSTANQAHNASVAGTARLAIAIPTVRCTSQLETRVTNPNACNTFTRFTTTQMVSTARPGIPRPGGEVDRLLNIAQPSRPRCRESSRVSAVTPKTVASGHATESVTLPLSPHKRHSRTPVSALQRSILAFRPLETSLTLAHGAVL